MTTDPIFRLVSELIDVSTIVNDVVFTDVSDDGEMYTTYRIIRFTHTIENHPQHWTHQANIASLDGSVIGVALLDIRDRIVMSSQVVSTRSAT